MLSTAELAAIRAAGFEAAGQVLGAAVYSIGYSREHRCGGFQRLPGELTGPPVSQAAVTLVPEASVLEIAYRAAIGRMAARCRALAGHGVVGVRLSVRAFPAGGLEFQANGTAVRASGAGPLARPFASDLSGQDFAKLILSGWVPAGLALGIAVGFRHEDNLTRVQTRRQAPNLEVEAQPTWYARPGTGPAGSCGATWPGTARAALRCRR